MKPEDRLLLLCARQDFSEGRLEELLDLCSAKTIVWEDAFSTANRHGVAPLVWANLEKAMAAGLPLPVDVVHKFQLCCYRNVVHKGRRREKLAEALALLAAHSIEVMALKSAALDLLVYEQPWYTTAEDMDLVLRPRKHEVPSGVLAEIAAFFAGQGIEYEFHEHHDVTMNGSLPVDFDRIWSDARSAPFQDGKLLVMSTEDLLLSLCINSGRKRFFRLRSLVDIAETVNRCRDLDWAVLVEKARDYRCEHITYTALLVTLMTLGCDLPEGVLARLSIGQRKAAFLHRLVPFLIHRLSLTALSYYTGWDLLGRKAGWSLVLPYASGRWRRIGHQLKGAYEEWRLGDP